MVSILHLLSSHSKRNPQLEHIGDVREPCRLQEARSTARSEPAAGRHSAGNAAIRREKAVQFLLNSLAFPPRLPQNGVSISRLFASPHSIL